MKDEVVFYENQFIFKTWINEEGVYVKIFPIFLQHFPWDIISKAYLRKYNPILEYGGWGVRTQWGIRWNSIAYNAWGNKGLQLELSNGKQILIGTRKPLEMYEVLRKLNRVLTKIQDEL